MSANVQNEIISKTKALHFSSPNNDREPFKDSEISNLSQGLPFLNRAPKTVKNPDRYLRPKTVLECLEIGGLIDKVFCGNGFTTAFSNLPNESGKPDILVVPNIATAQDKEKNKRFAEGKTVSYFYSGSRKDENYNKSDLIVAVADSFLHYKLSEIDSRFILLDEEHTAIIQSTFRSSLYRLFKTLNRLRNVSMVTATPYDREKVNVLIENTHSHFKHVKPLTISNSYDKTLKRIEAAPGRVIIATNEAARVAQILSYLKVQEINLMAGASFKQSLFAKGIYKVNPSARITIMTTSAFEGHDIIEDNVSVFVIQNTAATHVQFLAPQIIQALGRVRNDPRHLELFWYSQSYGGTQLSETVIKHLDELEDVCGKYCKIYNKRSKEAINPNTKKKGQREAPLESENFDFRYKGDHVKLGAVRSLIIFNEIEGERIAEVNLTACDVMRSKLKAAKKGIDEAYYRSRGYSLEYENEPHLPPPAPINLTQTKKATNYCKNHELNPNIITASDVVRWSFVKSNDRFKSLPRVYTILANHLGDQTPKRLNTFFAQYTSLDDIVKESIALYEKQDDKQKTEKHSFTDSVIEVVFCFLAKKKPAPKVRAFRNYHAFTAVGTRVINHISSKFGIKTLSFDLPAFAPTTIQTLSGAPVVNWYSEGEDRDKSKIIVNRALNCLHKNNRTGERALSDLKNLGIDPQTIEYIQKNFYKNGRANHVFNTYTYHEREIISQAARIIKSFSENALVVPRHDEVLVFYDNETEENLKNLKKGFEDELNKIEYLNRSNWFYRGNTTAISPPKNEKNTILQKNGGRKASTAKGLRENVTHIYSVTLSNGTTPRPREPMNHPPELIKDPHDEKYYSDIF